MGINTGFATVGNFGSRDRLNYTALGDSVNLASVCLMGHHHHGHRWLRSLPMLCLC
jgi:class 3 adenylate cyclase